LQATGTTLAGYLVLFRSRQAELLARGEAAGHPAHVAGTLGLALSRLADAAPPTLTLLRLLAHLAPEPVPLALVLAANSETPILRGEAASGLRPLLGHPIAAGDAITALRQYSLLAPAGNGLVLVHRLVQDITRSQLTACAAGSRPVAAELVSAAIPHDADLPGVWSACATLLPHARAALSLTSDGLWRIAGYLGASGSYTAARDLYQLTAEAHQTNKEYGPGHPDTLGARSPPGRGQRGDSAAARDQYAALLPIQERILGPDHPNTLTTRGNIATWTGGRGTLQAPATSSPPYCPSAHAFSARNIPSTLLTRGNLAFWTSQTGDAAAARDQYAALLPIEERILGPEHPQHPEHQPKPRPGC